MKNIDFKKLTNDGINYIKDYPLFMIINFLAFIMVIFAFIVSALLGLVIIILWLTGIIIFIKTGGYERMKNKKKGIKKEEKTSTKKISKKEENLTPKQKKKRRRRRKFFKFILNTCLLFILLGLIGGIVFAIYIVINAPDFNPDNLYRAESSIIYDRNGNQITKIGIEKRKKVSYDDLPQVLVDAIVATEDSRYYQHNGFDLPRFTKAALGQVINKLTHHGNAGGGSTISMQVVKNNFTTVDQTITRKFTDIYISIFKLEKNYSKEEILEYYVNTPFLGNGSYGVEQACQSYFGKSVSDINLSEASIIAGLFQAPSAYDPYRFPEETEERRNTVLYLMRLHGYITKEEEEMAKAIPVKSLLRPSNPEVAGNEFQSFIDIVIDEVEEKTGKSPYTTGMKIYTTLDTGKQRVLNDIMSGKTWTWKDDYIQAGVGVLDTQTGAILAIGGGRNRTGERQYNYATMVNKQIGSTAKPLFDYGPAIEYNNFCLSTPFYDAPYTYSSGAALKNWDGGYMGVITLKEALAQSRNIPAVKAFQSVDNGKIKEFVTNLGMTPEIDSEGKLHEAHSLGAFTGTNPVQLAGAYAAFGNGGYFNKPYSVSKVEYIDTGKTVSLKSKKVRVMSDATAYMITDTLLYAVEGTGNIGGTVSGVRLAAKTGTTNLDSETIAKYGYPYGAVNDVWTAGYTPELTISIWYGYDILREGYYNMNGVTKNELYRQIVDSLVDRNVNQEFEIPSSVVKVSVEKETYPVLKPGSNTPGDFIVTEYCKRGTEPSTASQRFNKIDAPKNLKISETDEKVTLSWGAVQQPNTTSFDYFKKMNSVLYAQHVEEKYAELQSSNGPFGYSIIENGTPIGFTTSTTYSFKKKAYDANYTVRAMYQNNLITQSADSNMVSANGNKVEPSVNPDDYDTDNLLELGKTISIDGSVATLSNLSNYIKVTDKDGKDITSKCNISASCTPIEGAGSCSVDSDLATFTAAGKYSIDYTISYQGVVIPSAAGTVTVQ